MREKNLFKATCIWLCISCMIAVGVFVVIPLNVIIGSLVMLTGLVLATIFMIKVVYRDELFMLPAYLFMFASLFGGFAFFVQYTTPTEGIERSQGYSQPLETATIRRIIDGDTIDVYMPNGEIERIRLIGIDAPEVGRFGSEEGAEPGAIEARDFVEDLIPPGTTVWLEARGNDRDRWDRLRRYVWIDVPTDLQDTEQRQRLTVNRLLLTHGHAVVWP